MVVPKIPSMGGTEIGATLQWAASQVSPEEAIVEVGAWLGAGTYQMALGLQKANLQSVPIHCFDYFSPSDSEIYKAKKFGISLHKEQDTRPLIIQRVSPTHKNLHLHRTESLQATWSDGPIGLYVDDSSKKNDRFLHILKTFGPSWVPGRTIVVLMDLHFHLKKGKDPARYRCQQNFLDHFPDTLVPISRPDNEYTFRYNVPINFRKLRLQDLSQ